MMCPTNSDSDERPVQARIPALSRRRLLQASAATAAAFSLPSTDQLAAAQPADREAVAPRPFAMITDTHLDPDYPVRTERTRLVLQHIADREPAFVLHCGDVSDVGEDDDLGLYKSVIPPDLAGKIKSVPGNHEQMWNADAMERYRRLVGPLNHCSDVGGYRVIGLAPMVSTEGAGWYFGDELLDWLTEQLDGNRRDLPVICFLHLPQGAEWHFTMDGDDFLRVVTGLICGIFCGHIHKLSVERINAITQLAGKAIKNSATYYWAEPVDDHVQISEVLVASNGTATETVVATMPLASSASPLEPSRLSVSVADQVAHVHAAVPSAAAAAVQARPYSLDNVKNNEPPWQELTSTGRRWSGKVPIDSLPPGQHRLQLRVLGPEAETHQQTAPMKINGGPLKLGWIHRMPGRIRAEVAHHDGLVIVGSLGGALDALRPSAHDPGHRWRVSLGPIYKRGVFLDDGRRFVVPSADHHLYALDTRDGRALWKIDLGAPILSEPTVVDSGQSMILVTAGRMAHLLRADGQTVWRRDLGGVFTGRAASDGRRAVLGAGDGYTKALSLRTGEVLWSTLTAPNDTLYRGLSDGPWAAHPLLLEDHGVVTASKAHLHCLDRRTGATRWTSPVAYDNVGYTRPLLTSQGVLWFGGRSGTLVLSDPSSGAELWTEQLFGHTRDTSPVRLDNSDVYWMVGATGAAARVDVSQRTAQLVQQISPQQCFTTPAITRSSGHRILIAGDQAGDVRGFLGIW